MILAASFEEKPAANKARMSRKRISDWNQAARAKRRKLSSRFGARHVDHRPFGAAQRVIVVVRI
jgi:hypothetical protein